MYNSDFSKIQSTQAYMAGMRPVLNKRALFSDMSSEFVCPPDPNPYSIVTIKFRAAKNNIDMLDKVSKERIGSEFAKILMSDNCEEAINNNCKMKNY